MNPSKAVLLVEDDVQEAMAVKKAFEELGVANQLVHLVDGAEVFEYLANKSNQRPCAILLDINLAGTSGIELLRKMQADEQLRNIPVVVLLASQQDTAVLEDRDVRATAYIVKPIDYMNLIESVKALGLRWTLD